MAIAKGCLTVEQFLRIPELEPPLEYEDGRITQKVSPQGRHSRLQSWLTSTINGFAEPRKLAMALPELRTTYADRSLVPDIAVFRWERIPRDATGRVADRFTTPADIAIEIVSPDQSVSSLVAKCRRYVAHDVSIALLVDPDKDTVRLFRPGQPEQLLRGDNRIDLSDVLPGLDLTAGQVFAALQID